MFAHGGMFRTAGVAQELLAAALGAPVAVGDTASEGGAWGMAVLAQFGASGAQASLGDYLASQVFAGAAIDTAQPDADDVAGFAAWLETYKAGLAIEKAATQALA